MCGIAGKICFGQGEVKMADLERMTAAIAHRGPDDKGHFISKEGRVGLGQRRLSILDLSPLGRQPMNYLDRYWIVFNGEIYNFLEERASLEKIGYKFKSHSDTEVIMALYDKYGTESLNHLRGMFAFALYDQKEQTLFCARDRIGKKPFKYFLNNQVFIFASELKAILTQDEYKKEPDYLAIHHYLTFQYCPAPLTGFLGLEKLEPAHYLMLDLKTGKMRKKRYWRLDYSKKLNLSEAEWQKRILAKLEESVRLRLISDVPLGAFLSGGIDSSAVVGMMSRLSPDPVKTFSIGFKEEKFNELPFARQIAAKFKTDHTEFMVEPDAIEVLPMLVRHYEEPFADSSALPTYYVSKMTRDHVTVALNGDGGDENFAGYSRYSLQKFALKYDKLKYLALPASKIALSLVKNTLTERAYRFAKTLSLDYRRRYAEYVSYFTNDMKSKIYSSEFQHKFGQINSYDVIAEQFIEAKTPDKMDQTLYADLNTYLPGALMPKIDIASMIVALEGRSPFLDHEMLELTAQIPAELKLKGKNNKKYILKKALEGFVPNEILYRPKRGFSVPLELWFRGKLKNYAKDIILSKQALSRGIFDPDEVKALFRAHTETNVNYSAQIWVLLTLELWFREYFE